MGLTYLAAGAVACAWLRELGLPRGAALVGGLVFAIAPYRVAQSAGHLLGPISILLPAALWALERARRQRARGAWLALAGVALASIPLSGQLHLALGAIPFFVAYAACRSRDRLVLGGAGLAALVAVAAGALVSWGTIAGSIARGGRSLRSVRVYEAEWADFVSREMRHGSESFVFLGWLTPLLALAGLAVLVSRRSHLLALVLGAGTVVPVLLAVGTNLPTYEVLRVVFPPLRYPRVPERLLPIACLTLAALVAFAASRLRGRLAPALLVGVLALDLNVSVYRASAADDGNRAYAALRSQPQGRLLELPLFRPERHEGSVYLYYAMEARRERPAGYSTVAPKSADALARRLAGLNCGRWPAAARRELARLGVRYVAFHRGLYAGSPVVRRACARPAWRELLRHGFRPLARDGPVTMLAASVG